MQPVIQHTWKLTLSYFLPVFVVLTIFLGGIFVLLSQKINSLDGVLREITTTTQPPSDQSSSSESLLLNLNYDTEKVDRVISSDDWSMLSMKEIDDKLVAAGLQRIGNPKNPYYALKPGAVDSVISSHDWETLSKKEIDDKLAAAGLPPIGDTTDPLYSVRPSDMNGKLVNLSYVSASQLRQLQQSMNIQLLFFLFGGFLFFLLVILAISYFYSIRSLEPLKLALEKQKKFVSDASHQLRTPLAIMQSGIDVLTRDPHASIADYKQFAEETKSDIVYLQNLTNRLLEMSRIEKENSKVQTEIISLYDFLSAFEKQYTPLLTEKNMKLQISGNKDTTVKTNIYMLREILTELVDNAVKYSPSDSTIRIAITQRNNHTAIEVQDEGIGISTAEITKIFDRLYKVNAVNRANSYGIGLSLVHSLTKRLNIVLSVESTPGKGSNFILILP